MAYDLSLADRVRTIMGHTTAFDERKMFGGLSFMVNGHMCCGVVKTDLVLRLGGESAKALIQPHTRPMDFTGRPMKSMIYVDAAGTDSDAALEEWVTLAIRIAKNAE
jgi:TfoX/Sxy family transcriptional regulator of competence genes